MSRVQVDWGNCVHGQSKSSQFVSIWQALVSAELSNHTRYIYRQPAKLRKGNVFTGVSVHRGVPMGPLPMMH